MDMTFDAEEVENNRLLGHVYLARYMRTTPEEVERMPVRRRNLYLRLLSQVIKGEGSSKVPTEDNQ